jgi:hypothetical protein
MVYSCYKVELLVVIGVTSRSGALRHLFFEDTCSQVIWTLFDVGPYIFDYDVIDR